MAEELAYDLFISYAEADRAWVEGYLLDALETAEIRCHSESAFALGVPRISEFERAIQQSRRTLLVISPAYLADDFTGFTDLLAQSYGMETGTWPVIPLIRHPVPKLPSRLAMLTRLQATNEAEQKNAIERLCTELQRPLPAPVPKPSCPYPGMRPFRKDNQNSFYGRDREVQEMSEKLRLHPFLTVIGPSGSGKSSLVFAGLLPALERSGLFGSGEWLFLDLRPGENPLARLKNSLGTDLTDLDLAVTNRLATQPNTQRLLLVVDQFEELFTVAAKEEAIPFQEKLKRLSQTPNCYVILTVRADFYGDLMGSTLWQNIRGHRLEVVPLDAVGLRDAIVKPAQDVGVYVEAALVERLIADAAGEPGILPLLQETLLLLWERVERRFLGLGAYEALILPRSAYGTSSGGQRTGLQVAIARRADAALANLTDSQQAIARRIFLRLVQFGEGRADTRRQQDLDALRSVGDNPSDFEQVLKHLSEQRLLTLSGAENEVSKKVDISHEALIAGWPALQQWINERRSAEQTRRGLVDKAKEWERLGKSTGGLLDKTELAEAKKWLSLPDATELGRDAALLDLIKASQQAFKRTRRRQGIIGLAVLSMIGGIAVFAFLRIEDTQLERYVYSNYSDQQPSSDHKMLLSLLNKLQKKASKYEEDKQVDKALAYYRRIRWDSSQFLTTFPVPLSINSKSIVCDNKSLENFHKSSSLEEIYKSSEEAIVRLIECYRIRGKEGLEESLKSAQKAFDSNPDFKLFGELNNNVSGDNELFYTPTSPLQITYEILLKKKGANADLDNNLEITKEEANQIPCETLKRIEQLWREITQQKCGWYDRVGYRNDPSNSLFTYEISDCLQLQEQSLTRWLFVPPVSEGVERLNKCLNVNLKPGG